MVKDRLNKIWERQLNFNKNFFDAKHATLEQKQQRTKDFILYITNELHEVLRELNWKEHHRKDVEVREDKVNEEIVDVVKFTIGLAQIWGITDDEFYKEFERKTLVVEQKYKQEIQLNLIDSNKVVGVDLDDILCDWCNGFLNYLEKRTQKKLNNLKFVNINDALTDIFGSEKLKQLKHEFRLSNEKKNLKSIQNASLLTKELKKRGFQIIILSARPVKEYPKLYGDTIEWCKKNNIVYDAMFFDEKKEEKIIKEFPKMKFFVEDNINNANLISRKNYKVFLLNKPYNLNELAHKNIIRINNLKEILDNSISK